MIYESSNFSDTVQDSL